MTDQGRPKTNPSPATAQAKQGPRRSVLEEGSTGHHHDLSQPQVPTYASVEEVSSPRRVRARDGVVVTALTDVLEEVAAPRRSRVDPRADEGAPSAVPPRTERSSRPAPPQAVTQVKVGPPVRVVEEAAAPREPRRRGSHPADDERSMTAFAERSGQVEEVLLPSGAPRYVAGVKQSTPPARVAVGRISSVPSPPSGGVTATRVSSSPTPRSRDSDDFVFVTRTPQAETEPRPVTVAIPPPPRNPVGLAVPPPTPLPPPPGVAEAKANPTVPYAPPVPSVETTPTGRAKGGGQIAPGQPGYNPIDRMLVWMIEQGASDLHLAVGRPPLVRHHGRLDALRHATLDDDDFAELLRPILSPELWETYLTSGDADLAYEVPGLSRFRVNLYCQSRGRGAVMRVIPTRLSTVEELKLPLAIRKVVALRSGLVLVTGPAGSGKSTTLSAIINEMNETRAMHVVTIEDPIEFVHPNKKSLMSQREVGLHSKTFTSALRAAVREDPDAILVGEMRDVETVSMALNAAETGVLVLGTLHTNSAAKTLDRIINVFPAERQAGIRGTLASVTRAVVAQQLLRKKGGGRVAAVELMFGSQALASLVREGKTNMIPGYIRMGKREGMVAMDDALKALVDRDQIDPHAGLEKCLDKEEFRKWLKDRGVNVSEGGETH